MTRRLHTAAALIALATLAAAPSAHAADAERQARTAATAGVITGVTGFALGTISDAKMDNGMVSMVTGGAETLTFAIGMPLVAGGARRARRTSGVTGAPGLRLTSWTVFGCWAAHSALMFSWGIVITPGNTFIPQGQVQVNAALGMASTALMAGEALSVANQISALPSSRTSSVSLQVSPTLTTHSVGMRMSSSF